VRFSIAFNDIDFCLRLRANGYLNIYTPYCEAYHHESASRGYEVTPEKKLRFKTEIGHFRERWKDILATGDPYYNVNLTLEKEDFSFRV
jgi:GT2 family glycosyltransferase